MQTIACDLCRSENAQVLLRQRDLLLGLAEEEFSIVRCGTCGLLYLNPRPSQEEIGRYYPDHYYHYTAPPPKQRTSLERKAKKFSALIKRWVGEDYYGYPSPTRRGVWRSIRKALLWPEKSRRLFFGRHTMPWAGQGRLLDVGCGTGGNLVTLQAQGWDVYGIEMSEKAAAQARERVGDRILVGTLETAPLEKESFDLAFLSHSLEHFFSPVEALATVRRLLKPDGMVVIAVPNAASLEANLFGRWWFPWDPPRHLYHFERNSLSRLLQQVGFRVVRTRTGVGSLFFMASLERAWKHKWSMALPGKRLIDKLIARPLCLIAGHLGYGTDITVYAVKAESELGRREAGTRAPALEKA